MENKMEKFHKMELEYKLFDLGKEINYPFWDMIRVPLFAKYVNGYRDDFTIKGKSWLLTIIEWIKGLSTLIKRRRILFFNLPRDVNTEGLVYDKIAGQLIELTPKKQRLIINCIQPEGRQAYRGYSINLVLHILRPFTKKPCGPQSLDLIHRAFKESFNVYVPLDELSNLYSYHFLQLMVFKRLFAIIRPRKIICSVDQQKAAYWAAQQKGIPSYELQHAGIVFEYPSYSYPRSVNREDNISFAEKYIMFGEGWGYNNNIPCDKLVLGNDYFMPKIFDNVFGQQYIVIISDQDHSPLLEGLCELLSKLLPEYLIVYKLHPIQYPSKPCFVKKFLPLTNVKVVSSEYVMPCLLYNMQLMITVYSSVFFEAISCGKKVAVYEDDIYYLLSPYISENENAYLVKSSQDIIDVLQKPVSEHFSKYYSPFNRGVGDQIVMIS